MRTIAPRRSVMFAVVQAFWFKWLPAQTLGRRRAEKLSVTVASRITLGIGRRPLLRIRRGLALIVEESALTTLNAHRTGKPTSGGETNGASSRLF
mmetsp:Transcript_1164/g.2435  ORF Transcript_1164/g.2435 Transcript_1164/m.2435 type:complete len:95 (-) Transcript_1164:265-549(-)